MSTEKPSVVGEVGEIIKDLNLPKHVLDQVTALAKTLLGPAAKEFGELFADKVRYKRLSNQVTIFKKTAELLERNNLTPRELNLKTLVPLLEQSSLEEDEELQVKWANLIANLASSPENGLEPKLVKTLAQLSILEARVLDYAFQRFGTQRVARFEKNQASPHSWVEKYKSVEDVPIEFVVLSFDKMREQHSLTRQFAKIFIDNLVSLGLLRYEEPEIEIEDNGSEAESEDDPDMGTEISLSLSLSANYQQSDNFTITEYGLYFVSQCNASIETKSND